ncbi:MAG: DUF2326 domain-containing protein [Robiginitomaculum sp.]|nr:DUF2326 domain-containing protein [Robiginitomaculum sp.]
MFRIRKLYTEPKIIDPIEFFDGVNLVLGVKDQTSNKTNGVGKSLSMEFLNFALLASKNKSRVNLIPKDILPPETEICLDIELGGDSYTIKRSIENSEEPKIITNGDETVFSNISDATEFLSGKLFSKSERKSPSFRSILGPLIRDERSEFKSLVACYDTNYRIPDDYSPHIFLFGLDINLYASIRSTINLIDDLTKDIKKIKDNVKLLRQKDITDARSDLNELDSEVEEIEKSIDALENISGYEFIKDDIIALEANLEDRRREKSLLNQKLNRTKLIADGRRVDSNEIGEFFKQMSERLGDMIKRDLDEVYSFKAKIDDFQNQLIQERRGILSQEISRLAHEIAALDRQYTQKLSILDQQGSLRNLKQTYAAFQAKAGEASQLRAFIDRFEELETLKQEARTKKEAELLQLQSDIQVAKETIKSFEGTILDIHNFIQGNKKAAFEIKPTSKKQVVEIVMRIDDDGSHSVEREKVFIYDLALLLNENVSKNHPGILIHDNIFDVDQDTLIKNIKYLVEKAEFRNHQQYILTLNSDRLDQDMMNLISPYVRAEFTKKNRFLKAHYQELH